MPRWNATKFFLAFAGLVLATPALSIDCQELETKISSSVDGMEFVREIPGMPGAPPNILLQHSSGARVVMQCGTAKRLPFTVTVSIEWNALDPPTAYFGLAGKVFSSLFATSTKRAEWAVEKCYRSAVEKGKERKIMTLNERVIADYIRIDCLSSKFPWAATYQVSVTGRAR